MAIRKRLSDEERAKATLPKGWERAVRHPIIQSLWSNDRQHYWKAQVAADAIKQVKAWRGASWQDKVFVIALDLLMEKAFGTGVLEPDAYNRLWDHLHLNEDKMLATGLQPWHTYMWDIYHDAYRLNSMEPGDLELPVVYRKIKLKRVRARK